MLVLMAVGLTACQDEEKKLVCFRLPVNDEWGTQMLQEMANEAAQYPDIQLEISYVLPGEGDSEYLEFIEQSIERKASAIIIYPYVDIFRTYVQRAINKGIGVVVVRDEQQTPDKYSCSIYRSERDLGHRMAYDVAEQMQGHGTILELYGGETETDRCLRSIAFHEVIDTMPGIRVVGSLYGDYKSGRAYEATSKFLQTNNDDIDMVVGMNDRMALGARKAIERVPRLRQHAIRYMGVDVLNNDSIGIGRIEDGSIDVSYHNPTGGKETMHAAACLVHGEPYEMEHLITTKRITRANAPMLRAQYDKEHKQYELQRRQLFNTEREKRDYMLMQSAVSVLVACLVFALIFVALLLYQLRRNNRMLLQRDEKIRLLGSQLAESQTQQAVLGSKCEQLETERDRWMAISGGNAEESEDAPVENRDFRTQLLDLIKGHMSEEDFSVDQISETLCMSRSQLFRRCKTEFDMSPADLLRTMRLECAEHLLLTTQLSVSEVAYRVGYANNKYFSRSYKDRFGVVPSDVRKKL